MDYNIDNNGILKKYPKESRVKEFVVPEGVTSIGDRAFEKCINLRSITIPEGVTSIGDRAFVGCLGLRSITIPESVTSIGEYAFMYCGNLKSIVCPNGLPGLGEGAFYECSGLTNIVIREGVTSIKKGTFYGCSGLTSITIPEGVTRIGNRAFKDCKALTGITIPESVTNLGPGAFYGCSGLAGMTIPESVTKIGDGAFLGCSDLTEITIPDGVASIGDYTFKGCCDLKNITIPGSVTSIGDFAFKGCYSLKNITIPEGVTSIGDCAFEGCTGLTSITIPDGVASIGECGFYNCSGLTSITIPESLTKLGDWTFEGSSVSSLAIRKSVPSEGLEKKIAQYLALKRCFRDEIDIPDPVLLKKVFDKSERRYESNDYGEGFVCVRSKEEQYHCQKCMRGLNEGKTEGGLKDYNCLRLADYYVWKYISKYASEMYYALKEFGGLDDPERYPEFKIISLGSGDAADLMAFDALKQGGELTQPIRYYGLDKSCYWKNVQTDIETSFNPDSANTGCETVDRARFKRGIDVKEYFKDHPIKGANVICIQYLISSFYDKKDAQNSSREIQEWFKLLTEQIVKNKPKDKPMLIVINDVNEVYCGRDTFELFAEEMESAGLTIRRKQKRQYVKHIWSAKEKKYVDDIKGANYKDAETLVGKENLFFLLIGRIIFEKDVEKQAQYLSSAQLLIEVE